MKLLFWIIVCFFTGALQAEDGYQLWLRYNKISQPKLLSHYKEHITEIVIQESSPTFQAVEGELQKGLSGLLGKEIPVVSSVSQDGAIVVGTLEQSSFVRKLVGASELESVGADGFIIRSLFWNNRTVTVIAANQPKGALYGSFHFLRLIQTQQPINKLSI